MRIVLAMMVAAPLLMAPSVPQQRATSGLCRAGEPVIFACKAGAKWIAVCGAPAQYRVGTPGKLEMTYPAAGDSGGLARASTAYSGGGEAQIVFARGGYRYVVFSSMIRTGFGKTNDPAFESGVTVIKDGRTLSTRKCTDPADAPVDLARAEAAMPETDFVDR
jgi:hypothetical protein